MSNKGFFDALNVLDGIEGGLGLLPGDRGKLTNRGVTQVTYDKYRDHIKTKRRSVAEMTEAERADIYLSFYWEPAHCNEMTWPLNVTHFVFYVNVPPGIAIRVLQRALEVQDDGDFGPITLRAVKLASADQFQAHIVSYRHMLHQLFYYDTLDEGPDPERDRVNTGFLTNLWIKRVKRLFREINHI